MHANTSFQTRRGEIEHYFDRAALQQWEQLTSDAPVSGIRATVREGRDRMRSLLLDWLGTDLRGLRLLDAGCGTGALAMAAARRGASVVAIDISPALVQVALRRCAAHLDTFDAGGSIDFRVGDMTSPELGEFDAVVAMDSLIHYTPEDMLQVVQSWSPRVRRQMLFTFAPSGPLLVTMHAVGRFFPRSDRAPMIEPVTERDLRRKLAGEPALASWQAARSQRVARGFYTSQAFELVMP